MLLWIRRNLSKASRLAAALSDKRLDARQIEVRVNSYLSHQITVFKDSSYNKALLEKKAAQLGGWLRSEELKKMVQEHVQTYVDHLEGFLRQERKKLYPAPRSLEGQLARLAQQIDIQRTVHIKPVYEFVDRYREGSEDFRHQSKRREKAIDLLAEQLVLAKPDDWLDLHRVQRKRSHEINRDSLNAFTDLVRS